MKHVIAKTRNGVSVYVDLIYSQAAGTISRQPYTLGLLKELIERTTIKGTELRFDQDMGRGVGHESVIETSDTDVIVYARRLHDDTYTRFVRNGTPNPTQFITVVVRQDTEDSYELMDTWIGRLNPPRPGSGSETTESKDYWSNHAYVLNGDPVQSKTITKDCPY